MTESCELKEITWDVMRERSRYKKHEIEDSEKFYLKRREETVNPGVHGKRHRP
ncbi:hypothetical protein RUM43_012009, partial [Polyplax serrata]